MKITFEMDGRKVGVDDTSESCQAIIEDMVVPGLLAMGYHKDSIDDVIIHMAECIEIKEKTNE